MEFTNESPEAAGLYMIRIVNGRQFPRPSHLEVGHDMRGVHERSVLPVDSNGFTLPEQAPIKVKKKAKSRAKVIRENFQPPLHDTPLPRTESDEDDQC